MDFDPDLEQARYALLPAQRTEACSKMWASCAGPRTADSGTLTSSACSCQDTVVPAPPAKPHCVLTSHCDHVPGTIVSLLNPLATIFTEL